MTDGDLAALTVSGLVGALAAVPFVAERGASPETKALAYTGGALVGLAAGDRLLVRRFDHEVGEGALLGFGAAAGALAGAGVGALVEGGDAADRRLTTALAAAGAVAGIGITEWLVVPHADAGRFAARVQVDPVGLALAATGAPGNHPLLRVSF